MPDEPDILTYPRLWEYVVIGQDRSAVRAAIAEVFVELKHTVADAHRSRAGRYCSIRVEATVRDELHRNDLFAALVAHADVTLVL